mgnify:CR=1 FL=1
MDEKYGVVATPVLHLMKKSIRRMFILLIIFITLFVLSIERNFLYSSFFNSLSSVCAE